MLNRIQLIGHLGADPETRYFPNGDRYVKFRLAATERWKDRETGEKKERTEWVNIVAYRPGLVVGDRAVSQDRLAGLRRRQAANQRVPEGQRGPLLDRGRIAEASAARPQTGGRR